jgi:hypothetical protein
LALSGGGKRVGLHDLSSFFSRGSTLSKEQAINNPAPDETFEELLISPWEVVQTSKLRRCLKYQTDMSLAMLVGARTGGDLSERGVVYEDWEEGECALDLF